MSQLPLPIRLAAGLAAVALERAKTLPQDATQWPMTAVSHVLQVSMRVQQRVTELAIKGDEALAGLREPEEDPPWAVFDEELPADRAAGAGLGSPFETVGHDGHGAGDDWLGDVYERAPRSAPAVPIPRADELPDDELSGDLSGDLSGELDDDDFAADLVWSIEAVDAPDSPDEHAAAGAAEAARAAEATGAIEDAADAVAGFAVVADPVGPSADPMPGADAGTGTAGATPPVVPLVVPDPAGAAGDPGPAALPSYPELSLASVRARLRILSADDLRALLQYEVTHADRPEFVRMLTNRIATVTR